MCICVCVCMCVVWCVCVRVRVCVYIGSRYKRVDADKQLSMCVTHGLWKATPLLYLLSYYFLLLDSTFLYKHSTLQELFPSVTII